MKCENARWLMSAYQDGELAVEPSRELEMHVQNCASCRSELQVLNGLLDVLHRLTFPAADPGFSTRVMAGLKARPRAKLGLLPSLAYSLALLLVFVTGFLLEMSATGPKAVFTQSATTFSAVLSESRDLGLLAVHDSTLELLGDLKQISLVKKQDNLLSKSPIPPLQGTSLRSRVNGGGHEN